MGATISIGCKDLFDLSVHFTINVGRRNTVFIPSIFAIFRIHLMHIVSSKAMGLPNNHATGHPGQIDVGRLQE